MGKQLSLALKTWGGRRKGAGRKPNAAKAGVSHLQRPKVTRHLPAHVTLRVTAGVPNLRRGACFDAVITALTASQEKSAGFRLTQYSVQSNHFHLIVEADSSADLARGMKALCVRLARALNRARGVGGRVFADRYHLHVLRTPAEVRHALAYVLNNFRKHGGAAVAKLITDACSSAASFDGWRARTLPAPASSPPVARATSWLLTLGWRRRGLIDPLEVPHCPATARTTARSRVTRVAPMPMPFA